MVITWKKENTYTRKSRKDSELQVTIELTTLQVLGRMLYGEQGRNLIIITPATEDCIGDLLEIGRPSA